MNLTDLNIIENLLLNIDLIAWLSFNNIILHFLFIGLVLILVFDIKVRLTLIFFWLEMIFFIFLKLFEIQSILWQLLRSEVLLLWRITVKKDVFVLPCCDLIIAWSSAGFFIRITWNWGFQDNCMIIIFAWFETQLEFLRVNVFNPFFLETLLFH